MMLVKLKTEFLPLAEYELLLAGYYPDYSPALVLVKDGEIQMRVTSYVPEHPLEEGYVYIKNYSENRGVLTALLDKKIVKKPKELIWCNFIMLFKCEFHFKTINSLNLYMD